MFDMSRGHTCSLSTHVTLTRRVGGKGGGGGEKHTKGKRWMGDEKGHQGKG